MILFLESGRLGNQLFQYAALRTIAAGNERLVLVGFDALRAVFANLDAVFPASSRSILFGALSRIRPGVERWLTRRGPFSLLGERFSVDQCDLETRPGPLRKLQYCLPAYFQSEALFDRAVVERLVFRPEIVAAAQRQLANLGAGGRTPIFVHIRRSDYVNWPTPEASALLPAAWYGECMDRMREQYANPHFVLCSDDVSYAREQFGDRADAFIAEGTEAEDFVLMCQCDAGILSASAYSWWAAYFIRLHHQNARFLAPEFWAGHGSGDWFPIGVKTSFLEYVPVPCAE